VPADASVLCDKAAVIGAAIKDIYDVHKLAGLDDDECKDLTSTILHPSDLSTCFVFKNSRK